MRIGFGLGVTASSIFTRLANGVAPTNTLAPSITGVPQDGTSLTFNVGEWTNNVAAFEIEVRSIEATPVVYLARQSASNALTGSVANAVGKTIELRVWATGSGGTTGPVSSAAFGPITAAGDMLILALAMSQTAQTLPTSPVPYIAVTGGNTNGATATFGGTQIALSCLYPVPNPHTGMSGASWGWNGTIDQTSGNAINTNNFADPRGKGRMSGNITSAQGHLKIDIKEAGTYRLYLGLGASTAVSATVNIGVWEGAPTNSATGSIYQLPATTQASTANIVDATGVARPLAEWAGFAGPGMGQFAEFTVSAPGFISIGKTYISGAGATVMNCLVLTKKAA